jgi:hypothetical protein
LGGDGISSYESADFALNGEDLKGNFHIAMARFPITLSILLATGIVWSQDAGGRLHPAIPKTWVDAEIASLEVPLADPAGSPKHVAAEYYYRIPVRPI